MFGLLCLCQFCYVFTSVCAPVHIYAVIYLKVYGSLSKSAWYVLTSVCSSVYVYNVIGLQVYIPLSIYTLL